MMSDSTDPKNSPTARREHDDEHSEAGGGQPRRSISGPGAADFLAATGGLDMPENDPAKGTRAAGEEGSLTDASRLTPDLDEPRPTTEREVRSPDPAGGRKK